LLSYIVKQDFTIEAPEVNAKIYLDPVDSVSSINARVSDAILEARIHGEGEGERFANIFHKIPGGKAVLMKIYGLLDSLNLAPWSLLRMDPLYTSIYFANLGSLGLDAPQET